MEKGEQVCGVHLVRWVAGLWLLTQYWGATDTLSLRPQIQTRPPAAGIAALSLPVS